MTYGVPYSFVPGTKAKADEVNANFIDVLTKIEDTNLRIDETISSADAKNAEIATKFNQVDEAFEQVANTDLSNLSSTGSAVLSAKANATDIDGRWVYKLITLVNNSALPNTGSAVYSLSSYLPNDGCIYEVMFSFTGESSSKGQYNIDCGYGTSFMMFVKASNNAGMSMMPISTARTITLYATSLCSGTNKYTIRVVAYRKVR